MSSSFYGWAFHSESEEELLAMVPPVLRGEATWSELRKYGIGWWVRSNDTLRRLIEKVKKKKTDVYDMKMFIQLNLSTTATLGTEKNDRRREVAVVEKFKQESLY